MSEIVSMACNEGRYEDMTTLQAVMQVSRRWYSVAAPRFWRVRRAVLFCLEGALAVSYTHLTLPTIYSV